MNRNQRIQLLAIAAQVAQGMGGDYSELWEVMP